MRLLAGIASDDGVVVAAAALDEAVFGFEVFPLMVCVNGELNHGCVCCVNRLYIIKKGDEFA